MNNATSKWKNHNRGTPCPVCGKASRCKYTADGAHRCFRSRGAVNGWQLVATCKDGTGVYRDINYPLTGAVRTAKQRSHENETNNSHNWATESDRFCNALTDERLIDAASGMGVSPDSLRTIRCGWADESELRRLEVYGEGWGVNFPTAAWSFPECDGDGRIIGIVFRASDGRKGFPKGGKRGLIVPINLDALSGAVHLVEGPSDVAAFLTMGVAAVGRPNNCGGADHATVLLADRDVLIVGENDQRLDEGGVARWPGREGAESVAHKLATGWGKPVMIAMPPRESKDVRAWLNSKHLQLEDALQCAAVGEEITSYLCEAATAIKPSPPQLRLDVELVHNRAKANVKVLVNEQLAHLDSVNLNDAKARTRLAQKIVEKDARFTQEMVERELLDRATGGAPPPDDAPRSRDELLAEYDAHTEELLAAMPQDVREEAEGLLLQPKLINHILGHIEQVGVVGERELSLCTYVIGTSRLLDEPVSGITQGTSSSGKSCVQKYVASLFPPEAVFNSTDLSPMSLYYTKPGSLMHRFVTAGERLRSEGDDLANAKRALREMLSGGELSKAIAMKVNGRMETVLIRQYGPIAYIESTTQTEIFDEDINRCLPLSTDESPEQSRRVMNAIAARAQSDAPDVSHIIQLHYAMQRMLKRVRVRVPFASKLSEAMPCERPEGRRAIGHTIHLIQAIALLHQHQRSGLALDHGDWIEAELQDYVVARRLLSGPLGRLLGGALPDAVANLGHRLTKRYAGPFTTTQAADEDGIIKSRPKVSEYLRSLEGAGVVGQLEPGKGNKPAVWQVTGEVPEPGALWLPTLEQLEGVGTCQTV